MSADANIDLWRSSLWQQLGAAIDMLDNAITACPDDLWDDGPPATAFWYLVYHTLFHLDLGLTGSVADFKPPPPFTLAELDPAGVYPERTYSKVEMRVYLDQVRTKCRTTIAGMSDARAAEPSRIPWIEVPIFELYLYNLRHVQHHTARLYLILRQRTDSAPGWVKRARVERSG